MLKAYILTRSSLLAAVMDPGLEALHDCGVVGDGISLLTGEPRTDISLLDLLKDESFFLKDKAAGE